MAGCLWPCQRHKTPKLVSSKAGSTASDYLKIDPRSSAPEVAIDVLSTRTAYATGESPEDSPLLEREAPLRRTGWLVLKKVLETVRDGCDAFLPLKAALVAVVAAMETVDNVEDARDGFLEIARRIDGFEVIFAHYESAQDIPPVIRRRLERLSKELESIKGCLEAKLERGRLRRTVEALGDLQDIQSVFGELAAMMERFQVECNLNTEHKVEDLAAANVLARLEHIPDATMDAQHTDACMEGTRVGLLQELYAWSLDPEGARIFWLDGMAGTGKSAIAHSFCLALDRAGLLGGSFFCSRGTVRDDAKRILPTLATALARQDAAYKLALLDVLREHPDAAHDKLDLQVDRLLARPLRDACGRAQPARVLVVDALDECADARATELMLTELVSRSPDIPVKFFITSRPERHIRAQLGSSRPDLHRVLRLHEIEQDVVEADISHYLASRLREIRVRREASDPSYAFPPEWPSRADVAAITHRAGKLFIYAFTTVEYVRECPVERLEGLTGLVVTAGQPLTKALDDMYSFILAQVLDPDKREPSEISMTKQILAAILTIREPLCLCALGALIGLSAQRVRSMLDPLHAVVSIPPHNDSGVVSTFHASFGDYLTAPARAKAYFIDPSAGHDDLARSCFRAMGSDLLHFNVSGCHTSYLRNSEQDLATIPAHLIYSCLYWSHHLVMSSDMLQLLSALEEVFRQKFLFWVEVLSATGNARLASRLLRRVLTSEDMGQTTQSMAAFLHDANTFVVSCQEAFELSAPHVYLSALPSIHPTSRIAEVFWPKFKNIPVIHMEGTERQRKTILHIQEHTAEVRSVAFSPDAARIVSGSWDGTVRVWDARTGEALLKPFKGHAGRVYCVAFSPDGSRIASGSHAKTIRVWDAGTGHALLEPLEGHTGTVNAIAFSPDGMRIASGSNDKTVRVWDARTGEALLAPLEGHTDRVNSVAFSPDDTRIASGSNDNTIRVWDARTGEVLAQPFVGHTGFVRAVAYSPDGTRVVSGSYDWTIRVWDATTGETLVGPLEGHTGMVYSVVFSPDGARVVSGSSDRTLRVWDARTGEALAAPFEGHTDWVRSVAFSSDGTRIVSGADDKAIRVWDASVGDALVKSLEGHTDRVNAVAFSPNGTSIASGSSDKTVRLWDPRTGAPLTRPLEGHTEWVRSIAFSPDGTRIVSGSNDKTIRVWHATTGEVLAGPLEGHTHWVSSVAFSPDGSCIASGSGDTTIRVWDARTGQALVDPLEGHSSMVLSVAFSPDGSRIASGSSDRTIRLWDAKSGTALGSPLGGHAGQVHSVVFSPDCSCIISGSSDKTIRMWDARTYKLLLDPLEGHTDVVLSVAFSPDGTRIVSGSRDGTLRMWDAMTGEALFRPLEGHSSFVYSVGFSPDGTRVASGSADKAIRVWDVSTRETTAVPHSIAFSQYQNGCHCTINPSTSEAAVVPVASSTQSADPHQPSSTLHQPSAINHSFDPRSLYESRGVDDPRDILSLDSGWITGTRGELVLWVPFDYRPSLWWPRNTLMIGQSRAFYDLSCFYHGTEWIKCYTP